MSQCAGSPLQLFPFTTSPTLVDRAASACYGRRKLEWTPFMVTVGVSKFASPGQLGVFVEHSIPTIEWWDFDSSCQRSFGHSSLRRGPSDPDYNVTTIPLPYGSGSQVLEYPGDPSGLGWRAPPRTDSAAQSSDFYVCATPIVSVPWRESSWPCSHVLKAVFGPPGVRTKLDRDPELRLTSFAAYQLSRGSRRGLRFAIRAFPSRSTITKSTYYRPSSVA